MLSKYVGLAFFASKVVQSRNSALQTELLMNYRLPNKTLKLHVFRRCSSSGLRLLRNTIRRMKAAEIDQTLLLLIL